MTRAPTRTHFHRSRLIRVLTELALLDAVDPGHAFAEKLGLWLNLNDAITLCAALNVSSASPPVTRFAAKAAANETLADEFARVRAALVASITTKPGVSLEAAADYGPFRRYYAAQQRDMEASVRPLRARVREVLGQASPALRPLAALDATLEAILCAREGKVLATVPVRLERRFEQLRQAHQQRLLETQQTDNPALWMNAGAWLARFCSELQTVLLAELDIRLQPTVGLMEALNNEMTKHT